MVVVLEGYVGFYRFYCQVVLSLMIEPLVLITLKDVG